jgi:DNA-binding PadR family transcriptional regulator
MRGACDRDDDDRERETPARCWCRAAQHHRPPLDLPRGLRREPVRTPRAIYSLRGRDVEALTIIGTFRNVDVRDLQRTLFHGNLQAWQRDRARMEAQGLLERHRVATPDGRPLEVVTLTRAGKALMDASRPRETEDAPAQRFYSGIGKRQELPHDAGLYPMVERERSALESHGARLTRIVLDIELRETTMRAYNHALLSQSPDEAKRSVAEAYAVPVIDGRFQFPDVRLEYEQPNGERDHADLELVTDHYQRGYVNRKAQAGFRLYARKDAETVERRLTP